ncbi:ABC transporter ATP-binding protein/permease [Peptoniphilus sp. KCTC 25270]|uniref:ABC transporter ATP-binding protein n=1 Tax=Peptoniphilus sp. KCTC 25270 TaxID=2897414 RepID=UPI001E5A94BB|nr:ABC transporter ATP-binding protein [Peptoniphilus sp. KCTC 25270]MCD1147416.1 ABC transporter ATP-binding protein/permease [Peptoniphilus sp. KCTC 25270]
MDLKQKIGYVKPYFKPYYGILFTDLLCAGLTTVSEIVLPMILRHITNLGTQDLSLITYNVITKSAILFLVIKIVEVIASYYMTSIGHIMGASIERDMRRAVYSHLQTLSASFYNDTKVGQIMSRITNDLFDITEFAHHCPEEYFIGALKFVATFFILASINLPLTLVLYAMVPIMALAANGFRQRMLRAQRNQRAHMGDLNATIEDSLAGIRVTKSFANEEMEEKRFNKENDKFLFIKKDFYRSMAGFNTITKVFDGIMYLIVIIGGGYFMMAGKILPGDMVAYIMYVTTMLTTVRRIIDFTETFQKGMTGIERFQEIMATQSEIKEIENPKILENVKGEIVFDHAYFSYENGKETVLEDFNLKIQPGENIALVGPSGAGKTTICNLIPRFYDLDAGSITIDGQNIRELTLESLRNHIGMVQQDVYLFSANIMENIRYGKPDATEEEVIEAAKLANAYNFIINLEDGFKTYVGEKGVKLSGGQKQRISIARVFLKNPPILILDEATSALDNESEAIIQKSLEKLTQGRTTITIAHRLSTVENADKILVMTKEDGIIEEGNHKELMEKEGFYYKLYTKGIDLVDAFEE